MSKGEVLELTKLPLRLVDCEICGKYYADSKKDASSSLCLNYCKEKGHKFTEYDEKIAITKETPWCADCKEHILSIYDKGHYNHNVMRDYDRLKFEKASITNEALIETDFEKIRLKKMGKSQVPISLVHDYDGKAELPPVKAIAAEILEKHNFAVIRDTPKQLYHEENGVYCVHGEAVLRKILHDGIDEKYWKPYIVNAVVAAVKDQCLHERSEFDADPMILNCKNGFVDLRIGKMIQRDIKSLIQIDTEFKPEHGREEMFEDMVMWAAGQKNGTMLLQYMAASLTRGKYHPRALICMVGDGRNGKSTILNTYQAVLGQNCTSSEDLQDIQNDRFAASNLEGSLANISADIPSDALEGSNKIKRLVIPGDMLSVQAKNVQAHKADITAMMFFSCNEMPNPSEWSESILDRFRILPFVKKFDRDTLLENNLKTPEQRTKILNSLIFYLQDVINKDFTYTQDTALVKELWQSNSDVATLFIMTRLRPRRDNESHATVGAVHTAYTLFCKTLQKPEKTNTKFNQLMEKHGHKQGITRIDGENTRYWKDLALVRDDDTQTIVTAYTDHG